MDRWAGLGPVAELMSSHRGGIEDMERRDSFLPPSRAQAHTHPPLAPGAPTPESHIVTTPRTPWWAVVLLCVVVSLL